MAKKLVRPPVSRKQLLLIAGIVLVVMFCFGYTGRLIASSELKAEVAFWEAEVQMAEQQLKQSQEQLEYAKSDQYVIDKAHTDLGWAFSNEVAVWVLGDEATPSSVEAAQAQEPETVPYWQQWQQRFFGQ